MFVSLWGDKFIFLLFFVERGSVLLFGFREALSGAYEVGGV